MLRLMLNKHPKLAVPHESKFILTFYSKLEGYPDFGSRETLLRLLNDIEDLPAVREGKLIVDKERIMAYRIECFADLVDAVMTEKAIAMGKIRWGDKTPFYTPEIDQLWAIFPEAKIVHLVRDGRDVAVSQQNIDWLGNSLPRLAADWRWKVTICHKVGSVRGSGYFLEIKYEDLVSDTEPTLRRICSFLEEDYSPEMLNYHETAETEVPKSSSKWHRNSIRKPDPTKLGVWKKRLSKTDRIIFEQVAGDTLELFAYEREGLRSTWFSRAKNLYYAVTVRW